MQRALALDGVEFAAADFTFDQNGVINGIKNRTQLWAGTGGVFLGGVVANPSGFNITISGPLWFQANGELGIINAPANVTAAPSTTNYIIAVYQETNDTPATYYGGGGPPNIHANETPTVISRTTPAVLANGEVPLATVVTNGSTSTSITDTRVVLPSCDNSGNLLLGNLKTIDGMDPSVHQALIGTPTVVGHSKLGGTGGACPYGTLGGAWLREAYYDVGSTIASGTILDDANFSSVPVSSEPYNSSPGHGQVLWQQYLPTRYGDILDAGYGPRLMARYTLTFTAPGVTSISIGVGCWNQTIRVKANGTSLFSSGSTSDGAGQIVNFNTVAGTNTIVIYLGNCDGNAYNLNVMTSPLQSGGFVFTG